MYRYQRRKAFVITPHRLSFLHHDVQLAHSKSPF